MKIWNPPSFFISLIMSFIMPALFGLPTNLTVDMLFYIWPIRWLCAYLLVVLIVQPMAFKLAIKVFSFKPGVTNTKRFNPLAFFISLMMSFIMPIIFAVPMGMPLDICIYLEVLRWPAAYLLVNYIVNPTAFRLADKVFGFEGF